MRVRVRAQGRGRAIRLRLSSSTECVSPRLSLPPPRALRRPRLSPPRTRAHHKAPAEGSGDPQEMSGRAKFRATPIDPAVMKKIYDMRLTAPMGAAMRNAMRSNADEIRAEKQFKGFSRGPLYRDIPEPVMQMIGSTRKDKLTFIAGALSLESMPPPVLPEVAFCGRSNVGKSSLINAVTLSTTVRSSDKPGMTQQFNFFVLPRRLMLADLPGYGFAFANPHKMETWKLLMDQYTRQRKSLKRVFVLLDARHGLKVSDGEFMDRLEASKTSFQVIMTKTDLVTQEDLARRHTLLMDKLNTYSKASKTVRMVSAYTGAGLIEVANDLYKLSAKATDEAPKKSQGSAPAAARPLPTQSPAGGAPPPSRGAHVVGGGRGRERVREDERASGRGEGGRGEAKRPKRAGLGGKGGKYEGKWGRS
jgi:ribosome biogenesis GTP-binding protein YsxC/EngB